MDNAPGETDEDTRRAEFATAPGAQAHQVLEPACAARYAVWRSSNSRMAMDLPPQTASRSPS
jgi:hypothetical protein